MNTLRPRTIYLTCLGSMVLLSTACSSTDARRVEKDFGNSVRQMVQAQIYDPQIAHQPPILGPNLLDGVAGSESVTGYREAAETTRQLEITPLSGKAKKR